MDTRLEPGRIPQKSIRTWLFNPFHYIAGGQALTLGLVLLLLTGFISSLSNSHFDGVIDFHTGVAAPWWVFVSEGLCNWLALGLLLLLGGKVISASRVRAVDVLGTQALARSPTLVTALFALLPGYQRFSAHIAAQYIRTLPDVQTRPSDPIAFGVTGIVVILTLIWMVALMYRGFSVSCNVRGGKAAGVFIGALIVGELISKLFVMAMGRAFVP